MSSITDEQMATYRASALKRHHQKLERLRERHQLGLKVARQAADLLKQDFKVDRVALFGSMLSCDRVHDRSDVDLAVWGLNPQAYYRAVGLLQSLEPEISIDLVEAELAPPRILREIEETGVIL